VGLSGEIRPVNRVDQRIQTENWVFDYFLSKYNKIALKNTGIKIELVAKIEDVASMLWLKIIVARKKLESRLHLVFYSNKSLPVYWFTYNFH
jgi:hypothetical protein